MDQTRFHVRPVKTREDLRNMYDIRYKGYSRYFDDKSKTMDLCDFDPNCTILLAEDYDGKTVGTIRILDRRIGKIELDQHIPTEALFSNEELQCCEATRFAVPTHPCSKEIKWLLIKGVLYYCQLNELNYIIMSSRPEIARDYLTMRFRDIGQAGIYYHHDLGNTEHHSYILNIRTSQEELKEINPVLYDFFFIHESHIKAGDLITLSSETTYI